jgi:hypothetical protein
MRNGRLIVVLVLAGTMLAAGLLGWALGAGSSEAQSGTMHNCPAAGKWSIAVWEGDSGVAASDALTSCGSGAVDAAYSLDTQTQAWSRWFAGKPDVSNLPPLSSMQGVLALGSAVGPAPTPSPTATPAPTSTPAAQSFSGQGHRAISPIELDAGLTIITLTHTGSSNFVVWLRDSSGEDIELLVNEIGTFNGSTALGIPVSGAYALDINADGGWTVKIEQLKPTSAPSVPQTFNGTGPEASPLFSLGDALTTFDMSHDGSSNFAIWLLDSNGDLVDLLVNEIGDFDGSTAIGVPAAGVYILDIEADGDWTVSVHQ